MDHSAAPGREWRYPEASGEVTGGPPPDDEMRGYTGRGLLQNMRALITGGERGVGRAVAVAFAKEGADVAISYVSPRDADGAWHTARLVEREDRACAVLRADLSDEVQCEEVVARAADRLGGLDILVNNAAVRSPVEDLAELSTEQWERTFQVNVHSCFWLTRAALAHLAPGGRVINSGSASGLRGNARLVDYSASKGAVLAMTYSLAQALQDRGIRVNCVAPGPAVEPDSAPAPQDGRAAATGPSGVRPDDVAPGYVFFASNALSGYCSGRLLAPGAEPGPAG